MVFNLGRWYGKLGGKEVVFPVGTTLTIEGTLTVNGFVNATPTTLAVTTSATVGTTLGVTGDFSVNTNKFVVTAASGATAIKGDVAVNTNKFVVTATTGAVAAAGAVTVGTAGKPLIIDPAGSTSTPAINSVQIYFDGTDIRATNSDGKKANLTTAASWT